jgi:hypothetical protein
MPFVSHDLPLLLALLAIALLLGAAALTHFASLRASRVLDDVDLEDGPLQSFRGGLRWPLPSGLGATNTPPVLVGLELFEWGVSIGARWSWLKPFVPSWNARYEELWIAEHVRRGLKLSKRGSEGVRLRAALPGAPLIFWSSGSTAVLDFLESHGVAVVRKPGVTRLWSNE